MDVGEERDEWVVVVDVDGGERSVYTVTYPDMFRTFREIERLK